MNEPVIEWPRWYPGIAQSAQGILSSVWSTFFPLALPLHQVLFLSYLQLLSGFLTHWNDLLSLISMTHQHLNLLSMLSLVRKSKQLMIIFNSYIQNVHTRNTSNLAGNGNKNKVSRNMSSANSFWRVFLLQC